MKQKKNNRVIGKKSNANSRIVEAAEHLKDAMLDEQARIIRELKQENAALREDNVRWQGLYYATEDRLKGEKLQREFFERCLKSAESALRYKDSVIGKLNKKWKKRLAGKQDVIVTLNKEIEYQYKRREKAEKIIAIVKESLIGFAEKVKAYE